MKKCNPDYNNCTVNLTNSILKKYGVVDETKDTLAICDALLEKDYKNIVVILLDGMGKSIIDKNLEPDGFFATHIAGTYHAVFPPSFTPRLSRSFHFYLDRSRHSLLPQLIGTVLPQGFHDCPPFFG